MASSKNGNRISFKITIKISLKSGLSNPVYRISLFCSIINLGRNYGIGYIASARRTANIPKDFISNANYSFIFRHNLPQDLNVLREWFSENEEIFKQLGLYEFALFKEGELETVSKIAL